MPLFMKEECEFTVYQQKTDKNPADISMWDSNMACHIYETRLLEWTHLSLTADVVTCIYQYSAPYIEAYPTDPGYEMYSTSPGADTTLSRALKRLESSLCVSLWAVQSGQHVCHWTTFLFSLMWFEISNFSVSTNMNVQY